MVILRLLPRNKLHLPAPDPYVPLAEKRCMVAFCNAFMDAVLSLLLRWALDAPGMVPVVMQDIFACSDSMTFASQNFCENGIDMPI